MRTVAACMLVVWLGTGLACSTAEKVISDVGGETERGSVDLIEDLRLPEELETEWGPASDLQELSLQEAVTEIYVPSGCGDGVCSAGGAENCENCPADCTCTVCGNGICEVGFPEENWEICPLDCGPCGDGLCGKHESQPEFFCTLDCGQPCGDAICGGSESAIPGEGQYCPVDCGVCQDGVCSFAELFDPDFADCMAEDCKDGCGDGQCNFEEDFTSCPVDCGACGDGLCGKFGDQQENCPLDCVQPCGDGKCTGGENPDNCPVDCGLCGDGVCSLLEYSLESCPFDCPPNCGDGICQPELEESEKACPVDCSCVPTCNPEWQCGEDDNGCGQPCGQCPTGSSCLEHMCCVPACKGAQCGDDGCGGSCGACEGAAQCVDHQCVCVASCDGKVCGDDGCGGSCGTCEPDEFECTDDCVDGQCAYGVNNQFCLMPLIGDNPALNTCLPAGLPYAFDSCMVCDPNQSQAEYSQVANGTKCGETGQVCWYGKCCDPIEACENAQCGLACGVSCGQCEEGLSCQGGLCMDPACQSNCAGKQCGDDGCGGTCGLCDDSAFCTTDECLSGQCVFTPVAADYCVLIQDLGASTLTYCVPDGSVNPNEPCQLCDFQLSDEGWSAVPDGQKCAFGQGTCQAGVCCQSGLNCMNKECGDDGCGGDCGTCGPQSTCVGGQCLCIPDCTGKSCGENGCGGFCGFCTPPDSCTDGQCGCDVQCSGKECGNDGCGGSCGTCPMPAICFLGNCWCQPACVGKECGDDSCGGSCGECVAPETCDAGQCQCIPDCTGKQCGDDGCGGSCGLCADGVLCNAGVCGAGCTDPNEGPWDGCVDGDASEFVVNTYTYKMQTEPDVAMMSNGGFVVVWRSEDQDGSMSGIFGQVFGADGKRVGVEIPVNWSTIDMQNLPSVAVLADDSFVVAWTGLVQDPYGYGLLARHFDSQGSPLSGDVVLAAVAEHYLSEVELYAKLGSGFAAAWSSAGPPDWDTMTWSAPFGEDLLSGWAPVQLDDGDPGDQDVPALSVFPSGRTVTVFESCPFNPGDPAQDGSDCGVYLRSQTAAGQLEQPLLRVNETILNSQENPSMGMTGPDSAMVAWQSYGQGGQAYNIFARPIDSYGQPTGGEFQVTEFSNEFRWEEEPEVASSMSGRFVVVWSENNDFFKQYEVKAARFDDAGNLTAPYLRVNSQDEGYQWLPAVAMHEDGAFVVVWESRNHSGQPEEEGQDGYSGGIFALRFNADGTLCPVGDCVFQPSACPGGCDDGNPCTVGWCDPTAGCQYADKSDGSDCGQCGHECVVGTCASALCLQAECGDDGCGGSCGSCNPLQTCVAGVCEDFVAECTDDNNVDWDGCTQFAITEFIVNDETALDQTDPTLLPLDDGAFLVSWVSQEQDGFEEGVFARRFDSSGAPLGPEEQVNLMAANPQTHPRVARLSNGGWAFTWETTFGVATAWDVLTRAYDAQGGSPEVSALVNMWQEDMQWHPAVDGFGGAGYIIAWESRNEWPDSSGTGIFMQRFSNSATHQGGQVPVNSYTSGAQSAPAVVTLENDAIFVVWQSDTADPDGSTGIYGRGFDAAGENPGFEVPLNSLYVDGDQLRPAVDSPADGKTFVAAWESWEDGGGDSNVVASLFHATGVPLSDNEFVVSESVVGMQHSARVASLADGRFVVVWASCGIQGDQCDVHGRRFDATGQPVGGEFAVNTFTQGQQGLYQDGGGLHVAAFPDDSFGVVWCSKDQAGEGWDVYMQRFGWDGGRLYR